MYSCIKVYSVVHQSNNPLWQWQTVCSSEANLPERTADWRWTCTCRHWCPKLKIWFQLTKHIILLRTELVASYKEIREKIFSHKLYCKSSKQPLSTHQHIIYKKKRITSTKAFKIANNYCCQFEERHERNISLAGQTLTSRLGYETKEIFPSLL